MCFSSMWAHSDLFIEESYEPVQPAFHQDFSQLGLSKSSAGTEVELGIELMGEGGGGFDPDLEKTVAFWCGLAWFGLVA